MPENRKTVTPEEAQQWFEYFALREDLALEYDENGCYAREDLDIFKNFIFCSDMKPRRKIKKIRKEKSLALVPYSPFTR